ncbi:MAG: hypothetical protein KDI28_02610 [Pseudomonadales bacterium]|nr:hypothetical protein [Pseudomonadales bacterium]
MMHKMLGSIGIALVMLGVDASELPLPDGMPVFEAEIMTTFATFDARQAVAVDADAFYAVNNFRVTRHDKRSGEPQLQWDGVSDETGPLIHLDSGMVHEGRLYAAHSNYPLWPMSSSIEIWDTATMAHVASHSFGIQLGSMTWIDRHEGYWWGGFGNYDKVQDGQDHPYGETRFSQVVKMDDAFRILEQWSLPAALYPRLTPMSNSGGSWGADGYLYLTGHDYPEIYVMRPPVTGGTLEWVATVHVPGLNGQGIAWDRTIAEPVLWGILKSRSEVYRIHMPKIDLPPKSQTGLIHQPADFAK